MADGARRIAEADRVFLPLPAEFTLDARLGEWAMREEPLSLSHDELAPAPPFGDCGATRDVKNGLPEEADAAASLWGSPAPMP